MTALAAALAAALGREVLALRSVAGGDINDAYVAELDGAASAFVKTRPDAPAGEYVLEADGLAWLADARGPPVPDVLAVRDEPPRLLALALVEEGARSAQAEERFGRDLGVLHGAGAPAFGGERPLRLGPLSLPNEPSGDWPAFYAERRLLPLVPPARDGGGLSAAGARAVEAVCARLAELAGPPEPPARLHGDLWSGNVLWGADGRGWLVDPAPYGGHREVDLAMLRLFGTPGGAFDAAYGEAAPLADGAAERVGLWQLFPLLVHAVLFGGSYGAAVERTARRYAG